ncbi:MAG TPA: hypothetical protein VKM94_06710 [Blastocatellia bacterium]|nr:hypothetical protein [Blastocatellia bacterium]
MTDFFRAIYSKNATKFIDLVIPRAGAEVLLGDEASTKDASEVEAKLKGLRLEQVQPFRYQGKTLAATKEGQYPDGTTVRYMAADNGNLTIVTLVKKDSRWRVDVRWWLKEREMVVSDRAATNDKEVAVKKFLLNLLRLNRRAVTESIVPGGDINLVFKDTPSVPEPSDQLYALALEMPLIEPEPEELYPLPSGKLVKKGSSADEAVLVGIYGPTEVVFQLKRVKGEWRIVPEAYYGILNQ